MQAGSHLDPSGGVGTQLQEGPLPRRALSSTVCIPRWPRTVRGTQQWVLTWVSSPRSPFQSESGLSDILESGPKGTQMEPGGVFSPEALLGVSEASEAGEAPYGCLVPRSSR